MERRLSSAITLSTLTDIFLNTLTQWQFNTVNMMFVDALIYLTEVKALVDAILIRIYHMHLESYKN